RRILHQSYRKIENEHDTASIVNQTYLRLNDALQRAQARASKRQDPMDVSDYFRMAVAAIHRVLLDHLRRRRPVVLDRDVDCPEPDDPGKRALWPDFHERVAKLPAEELEVFMLCFYGDLKRREAAEQLGIPHKTCSRRWISATEKLKDLLDGLGKND